MSYVILGTIFGDEKTEGERFRVRFLNEVRENTKFAWYVDYWTEDAERYNVRYFSKSPLIHWTNENISQRDTKSGGFKWDTEAVAQWFTSPDGRDLPKGTYAHTFEFVAGHTASDSVHTVRIEAGCVTVNGIRDERAWERYVDQGIRGALSTFRIKRLVSLTIEQVE